MGLGRLITGRRGEDEAIVLLKKNGYRIIERNYRCRYGEIDIIARDRETIVFVEVKTRASDRFGPPKAGVDPRKQRHMIAASTMYLTEKGLTDEFARFDVISLVEKDGKYQAELIKNAFDAE